MSLSEEQRRLLPAIDTIYGYLRTLARNANRDDEVGEKAREGIKFYLDRLDGYWARFEAPFLAPAGSFSERGVTRRPTWMLSSAVDAWRLDAVSSGRINGQWVTPARILRPGSVVTVPGGPLPRPQWGALSGTGSELARLLGVPVLLWDYEASDGYGAPLDVLNGVALARASRPGRVVVVSHSFGGIAAGAASVGGRSSDKGPDAFVAVSSVLGNTTDHVSAIPGDSYRAANSDPRAFRRAIPTSLIVASNDIPSASSARAREFGRAYAAYGSNVRLTVVSDAGHVGCLMDEALIEEVDRLLG